MKQIYHFDCSSPPALSEKILRAEIERRKTQRQTALLALAVILVNWCLIIMALVMYPVNAFLSVACISYVAVSMCGGGVITAVFINKRRKLI